MLCSRASGGTVAVREESGQHVGIRGLGSQCNGLASGCFSPPDPRLNEFDFPQVADLVIHHGANDDLAWRHFRVSCLDASVTALASLISELKDVCPGLMNRRKRRRRAGDYA
jgi:hypothetical protein